MGITQLLIILLIVAVIFGTSRLRSLGGDLGRAVKSFRRSMDVEAAEARNEPPARLPRGPQGS